MTERLFAGLKKRVRGEITHQQYEDGVALLFKDRLDYLIKRYNDSTLFRFLKGELNLDNFLKMDEQDRNHDYAVWLEFKGVCSLTKQTETDYYKRIDKLCTRWLTFPIEYRRQFLDQHGYVMTTPPKGLEQEWQSLKARFFL